MLPGLYQCGGLLNEVVDTFIKMPEAFVLGVPTVESHINLLQHDRKLEERENFVIVDQRKIAPGFFSVETEKLIAREPAGLRRDRRLGSTRIARLRPIAQDESQIHQRIADGRHLPIEYRLDPPRVARVEHDVIQLEVVMDERRRRRNGQLIGEPLDDPLHQRDLFGFRTLPPLEPTAHLTLQKTIWLSKRDQSMLFDIDGVQLDQAVDESLAHSRRIIRKSRKLRWNAIADHDAAPSLHDEENRSDDRGVLAKM